MTQALDFIHGPRRDRTCDPLIKSQTAPRPARPNGWVRVDNSAERFMPPDRRLVRAGAEPPRWDSSWLQRGCRIVRNTDRE